MCGIAGFCSQYQASALPPQQARAVLEKMKNVLAHRGPDGNGSYLNGPVGLAHVRLSIRDPALGAQPMVRRVGDRDYAIVYNGEIYNAEELKKELQAEYKFTTTCDTEVILYGCIHDGPDFVKKLNGIFSFVIWDADGQTLLLCRDRAGVKPLFYTLNNGQLVFASEPKALFCFPGVQPRIDLDSLREIFGVGPARTPGCGVFKGVQEVRPGRRLIFNANGLKEETYWALESHEHTQTYAQTVEQVSWLVRDSVNRQMVSDVPVCSFLSGGIDSSIVTALASAHLNERGSRLNTFSFDFTGNDEFFRSNAFQPERDRPYVDLFLKRVSTDHHYLECDMKDLFQLLFTAVDAKDLPGMADVDSSLLYFCSLVRQNNKVALTGECADEIFGGYPWFYRPQLVQQDGFPWSNDFDARAQLLSPQLTRRLQLSEYAHQRYRDTLNEVPVLPGENAEERRRREISYLNLKWFMPTLLDRMDRTSMYCGLEARVPFADHRILDYLWNVPWEMKYRDGVEKALLRDACSDLLAPQLLTRKKSPYPKTYNPRYEQILASELQRILSSPEEPVNALLDREKTLQFLQAPAEYGKPWFGQLMAGPQMMAYLIQVNYWLKKYELSLEEI